MRMKKQLFRTLMVALGLSAWAPAVVWAQDASDLMRQAMAAQAERLANVENVTIVQDMMGMEMTMYMEKRGAGGTPVLMPVSVSVAGMTNVIPRDSAQADWSNPFQEEWVERARLVGTEQVDGHTVHVFLIDDFSGLELPGIPGGDEGDSEFRPGLFRFSLDEEQLYMRKVEMEGETVQPDGTVAPVQMTLFLGDYREVDGYLHPFVTRVISEGMLEAADVDQEELRAQLEEMQAQLDNLPQAQRAMMEGILGGQIAQLEEMLGGEGGMEMTMSVKEIRVNAGPPGGGN